MSWRDQLQQASFRGVEFFTNSHNYSVGRRNVVHQYPFQDEAFVEDLGQEADVFSISGYILQKPPLFNYFGDRDKLIEALKEEGPGILIHRYLGEKRVSLVGTAAINEVYNEGGICKFDMTFVEAGKNQFPSLNTNPISAMDSTALDSINRGIDSFVAHYDTAQSLLGDFSSSMAMIKSTLRTLKDVPATVISQGISIVTDFTSLISEVLNTPCDLAEAITGAFDSFLLAGGVLDDTIDRAINGSCTGRIQNPGDASRAADELSVAEGNSISKASASLSMFGAVSGSGEESTEFGGTLAEISVASPDSAIKQSNRQANTDMVRLTGLAQATRIAVRTDYESQQDAEAQLLVITEMIDDFIEYLGEEADSSELANQGVVFSNDEFYQAVTSLKPVFTKSMNSIGASLARTVEFDVDQDVLPTLKLAYDKYLDIDRADEIIERNKDLIFHPGFIPNGKTIDILSE